MQRTKQKLQRAAWFRFSRIWQRGSRRTARKTKGLSFRKRTRGDRAIAQAKAAGVEWPNNVLRHSYATYRLAQCQDAARVALEMGNSPQMLFRNYRELADEKDAADWFNIVPSEAAAKKIIPLRDPTMKPRVRQ